MNMSGVRIPTGSRDFSGLQNVQIGSVAHLLSYLVGTGFFFSGTKQPGRDVDHLPLSNANVTNDGRYTSDTPM
jgi:hypothetical protein